MKTRLAQNNFRGWGRRTSGARRCACTAATTAGFTLIEVVVSASLMAMILVSAYLCFYASVSSQREMEPRLEVIQNARVAMALMTADLRAACPLDKNSQFLGLRRQLGEADADNLDFATHNYTPRHPHEGDFCEESFFLQPDPETGAFSLWRRRNPTMAFDPLSGGNQEEIATGIQALRFEYYDGLDWYDTWGDADGRGKAQNSQRTQPNLSGMPEAVRITLWFDSSPRKKTTQRPVTEKPPPPLVFQTIARLNLAKAAAAQNTTAGATTTTTQDTGGQTQGVPEAGGQN